MSNKKILEQLTSDNQKDVQQAKQELQKKETNELEKVSNDALDLMFDLIHARNNTNEQLRSQINKFGNSQIAYLRELEKNNYPKNRKEMIALCEAKGSEYCALFHTTLYTYQKDYHNA